LRPLAWLTRLYTNMATFRASARHARRPWALATITYAYLVWSLGPLALVIAYSFNRGDSLTEWEGAGLRWWIGDRRAHESMLYTYAIRRGFTNSLKLALITTAAAVPIGVLFALGTRHMRSRLSRFSDAIVLMAVALPPVILASVLWLLFAYPLRSFPFGDFGWFGAKAQTVGIITLQLPFVIILTRARLFGIEWDQEECAMDLGAPPGQVVRRVILPQLWPAVAASTTVAFAIALGEFVITGQLFSSNPTRPLAIQMFADPSPRNSAVAATLAIPGIVAIVAVVIAFRGTAFARRWTRSVTVRP
jgi:spermidine/putrescine transport system permease protein